MADDDDDIEYIDVYIQGLDVTPDSVSEDGFWTGEDGMSCDVREMTFPVPEYVKGGPYETQTVLAVLKAIDCYKHCPNCKWRIDPRGIILMLEEFHLYLAAKCCNNMVWILNGGKGDFEERMA